MQYHPTWHAHYSHLESFVSQHKKIHIELYIISGTYHWCHSWVSRFRIIGPIYNTIPDNTMLQFSCKFDGFTWFVFWWAHLAQIMRKLGGVGWGARGILLKNGRGRGPRVKNMNFGRGVHCTCTLNMRWIFPELPMCGKSTAFLYLPPICTRPQFGSGHKHKGLLGKNRMKTKSQCRSHHVQNGWFTMARN